MKFCLVTVTQAVPHWFSNDYCHKLTELIQTEDSICTYSLEIKYIKHNFINVFIQQFQQPVQSCFMSEIYRNYGFEYCTLKRLLVIWCQQNVLSKNADIANIVYPRGTWLKTKKY
jgi:hypothetical protein